MKLILESGNEVTVRASDFYCPKCGSRSLFEDVGAGNFHPANYYCNSCNFNVCLSSGEYRHDIKIVECDRSGDGRHHYTLPPDSFDSPYCKFCYKGS